MTKARNIIFAALFLLVIFAAIEYKAADFIDVIPEALDNGEKSYIEGAPLQPLPELSFTRFMQGALQDETESYLSGCIPSRDQALLLNAAMQRVIIRTANIPFSFDAFPTFFGSSYIETLDGKRIQPMNSIRPWKHLHHPSMISLSEIPISTSWSVSSMIPAQPRQILLKNSSQAR